MGRACCGWVPALGGAGVQPQQQQRNMAGMGSACLAKRQCLMHVAAAAPAAARRLHSTPPDPAQPDSFVEVGRLPGEGGLVV